MQQKHTAYILWIQSPLRVEKSLLASGMSTYKGSKPMRFNRLVFEKLDEAVCIGVYVRKKVLDSSGGVVFAADAREKDYYKLLCE